MGNGGNRALSSLIIGGRMTEKSPIIRVLLAKPGLDSHDAGVKVVALALRDAGMEVIYTGLRQTAEEIARVAVQEDVDVVGLSIMSSAYVILTEKVLRALRAAGRDDVMLLVGGQVPKRDIARLKGMGVSEVFPTGRSRLQDIVGYIRDNARPIE